MDYSKLNAITDPYSRELRVLGALEDDEAVSKQFLREARKLYGASYIKEVRAFLKVVWQERKHLLWVERFNVRTSAEEEKKRLKADHKKELKEIKRKSAEELSAVKRFFGLKRFLRNKRKNSEKSVDVPGASSQIQCEKATSKNAIASDATSAVHSKSKQNADD